MFFRAFFCVLALAITTAAQPPRGFTHDPTQPTVAIAVSPDGNMIAVARGNEGRSKRYGRVELWNTRTGGLQHTITGFDGAVWSLGFSTDGKTLMTASTEYRASKVQSSVKNYDEKAVGELKWWNAQTGEFIKRVSVASEGVGSLEATWSPAGDVVALVERRSEWQLSQVSPAGVFGQLTIPTYINFDQTELRLLDAQTGERRIKLEDGSTSFRGYQGRVITRLERPVFSPDGTKVAALASEDVKIWDLRTGEKILTIRKLNGWPTALAFSEDSRTLAVASAKGIMPQGSSEISLWEIPTGKSINRLKGNNDQIASLQFAAHGRALLIGSLQYEPEGAVGTVKMWDLRENRLGRFNVRANEAVSTLLLIPAQGAVALQSGKDVELRDAKTWAVRYAFEPTEANETEERRRSRFLLNANRALAVTFSADGTTVSAEIPGEGTRVWDVRTGGLTNRIPHDDNSEPPLNVATNGRLTAEADEDGSGSKIQVRDANTKNLIKTIDAGQKVTAVAIDRSGQLLAAARADYSIGLWDLKTGALQAELKKHQDVVNALAFSPDGRMLASGGDDRTVVLWEISSGKSKRTLKGHDVTVTSIAFSPDGATLATGSGNSAVVLWNVANGKLDRVLR